MDFTTIKAENVALMRDGKILFETIDTKATSGTRWKTMGFTITRQSCLLGKHANGGYPTKLEHAIIMLNDSWKEERYANSKVYVTFTIPQSVVSKALIKSGMGDIKHDDVLYLHGIFQVTHNGKNYGSKKYSLPDIVKAESWANPEDFRDRFDVKTIYKAPNEPVSIQYKTSSGDIMDTETYPMTKWKKPGEKITVELTEKKEYQGKKYTIYKSYVCNYLTQKKIADSDINILQGAKMEKVQNRTITQRVGGVQFVAVMKQIKVPKLESKEVVESDWDEPLPRGIIAADKRGSSIYDVKEGIPATESLYLNVFSKNYLFGYAFKNVTGEKEYSITFTKTYHLKWEEVSNGPNFTITTVPRSRSITITKTVTVHRKYSYWTLEELQYYKIKQAIIENQVLPGQKVKLEPKEYTIPKLDFQRYQKESEHIKEPVYSTHITLSSENVYGNGSCPAVPSENFQLTGESEIGKIMVRNDGLLLGTKSISKKDWGQEKTEKPIVYDGSKEIGENSLYENNLIIPMETANDVYETSGNIQYEAVERIGEQASKTITMGIEELSDVTVHTPVVCNGSISDERQWNQMLTPDRTKESLILDRTFVLYLPTEGEHMQVLGYGSRDYKKYTEHREVEFPFDVYLGDKYYSAHTKITITNDETFFYLPIWVKEGNYTIQCRTFSISAKSNGCESMEEEFANLNLENYVAVSEIPVEVSGRLYGFQITDISDYPLWYPVFRKKDSLKPSGIRYFVGNKNENGIHRSDLIPLTIPLIKGSHPLNAEAGITPLGYTFRFQISTVGEMYDSEDFIQLTPSFYYVSKDGKGRQEVDLYYGETIEREKHVLVKVGSKMDLTNIKKRYLGNPYIAVPENEIEVKQRITQEDLNAMCYHEKPMFTFHHILLSDAFRTYTGENYTPTGKIPMGVDESTVTCSKQKWYGEYYLPSQVVIVPKGYDLVKAEQKCGSFNYREDFWLKDGYILIQFDIVTIKDRKKHLSYVNLDNAKTGFCNMWNREGYTYQRKDREGVIWNLEDGDTFLYDLNSCTGLDYRTGGTH